MCVSKGRESTTPQQYYRLYRSSKQQYEYEYGWVSKLSVCRYYCFSALCCTVLYPQNTLLVLGTHVYFFRYTINKKYKSVYCYLYDTAVAVTRVLFCTCSTVHLFYYCNSLQEESCHTSASTRIDDVLLQHITNSIPYIPYCTFEHSISPPQ